MTKDEAIAAMEAGEKVTWIYFTPEEWVTIEEGYYKFEDGCQCTPREFWQGRVDESWNTSWEIWNG